ncbi:uncharacterized protein LOC131684450 [Topomyia yanbarensis]|uniref:uncharacterized protein LOC131684450 n=1 Tax=Topomyia yanbarensis TaxID=2498891 RepID=UPI00273ABD42|nr:uncharacterized protein LOC131684450 [Topomyia yanbarensis]
MEKLKKYINPFPEFSLDGDYFYSLDIACVMLEFKPPLSKRTSLRIAWAVLKVLLMLQYLCFTVHLCRTIIAQDIEKFATILNMHFFLTVSIFRAAALAYHRDTLIKLKQEINEKSCQRDDADAYEMRKNIFIWNNKFLVMMYCYNTTNMFIWCFTTGLYDELFKIPFSLDMLPTALHWLIDVAFVLITVPWSYTGWLSFKEFMVILRVMRVELAIVVRQFDPLFRNVTERLEITDSSPVSVFQQKQYWAQLESSFSSAISHHSSFINNYQRLRTIASINFFVLLTSAGLMISISMFLTLLRPSFDRLPMQLFAVQCLFETYLCCSMFTSLEEVNDQIASYVYAIDWLSMVPRSSDIDFKCYKSIRQNALILQRQVHGGFTVRAGGMFELNIETFAGMVKLIHTLLTCMSQMDLGSE